MLGLELETRIFSFSVSVQVTESWISCDKPWILSWAMAQLQLQARSAESPAPCEVAFVLAVKSYDWVFS